MVECVVGTAIATRSDENTGCQHGESRGSLGVVPSFGRGGVKNLGTISSGFIYTLSCIAMCYTCIYTKCIARHQFFRPFKDSFEAWDYPDCPDDRRCSVAVAQSNFRGCCPSIHDMTRLVTSEAALQRRQACTNLARYVSKRPAHTTFPPCGHINSIRCHAFRLTMRIVQERRGVRCLRWVREEANENG